MTKPRPNKQSEKPNKQAQAELRRRITDKGLVAVVEEMQIGPDAIRSYLADLPVRPSTLWGIEHRLAMLATPAKGATAPNGHAHAQEANGGLRR